MSIRFLYNGNTIVAMVKYIEVDTDKCCTTIHTEGGYHLIFEGDKTICNNFNAGKIWAPSLDVKSYKGVIIQKD